MTSLYGTLVGVQDANLSMDGTSQSKGEHVIQQFCPASTILVLSLGFYGSSHESINVARAFLRPRDYIIDQGRYSNYKTAFWMTTGSHK